MEQLFAGEFYHIYNRGNNGENLFYQNKNYEYFLKKYDYFLSKYLDIYAFCLMPNHFHLLVKVREQIDASREMASLREILTPKLNFSKSELISIKDAISYERQISEQLRRLFVGYTMAINKQQNRHGSLFEKPFKRKRITDEIYLKRLVWYIHNNPIHHGFVTNLNDWEFSSYHSLITDKPTKLKKDEVLAWFDGKDNYQDFQKQETDLKMIEPILFDF